MTSIIETKDECLLHHPICQQDLKVCRPTLDLAPVYTFVMFTLYFLIVAILTFATSFQVKNFSEAYDNRCDSSENNFLINIPGSFSENTFLYYQIEEFYQNHFNFRSSYDADQLQGKHPDNPAKCAPFQNLPDSNIPAAPCGLFPRYFFNDTFQDSDEIFTDKGISWEGEIGVIFKNLSDDYDSESRFLKSYPNFSGEVTNEHFVVWMKTSNRPKFRKLYAKATKSFENISFHVKCNYPKSIFPRSRSIVLVQVGFFGGKNEFFCYVNVVLSVFSLIGTIFFKSKIEDLKHDRQQDCWTPNADISAATSKSQTLLIQNPSGSNK